MPSPVEALLKVYEDMVEFVLVLEILLAEESSVAVGLHCGALSCSEACLFLSNSLLRLRLEFVPYLQHDFAWVAAEADRSVVLPLLQVAFLGKCDDQGLGPRDWSFPFLPDLITDCRESRDYIFSTCLGQFRWNVVNSR